MTPEQIALREKINEARAKQRKFGQWEMEKAYEIQHLIKQQAFLEDEIIMMEYDYAKLTAVEDIKTSDKMWNLKKLLGGIGL